jgi:hypothetical protein
VEAVEIHRHIGVDVNQLQSALDDFARRISELSAGGAPVTAILYYSGHADQDFLRMGGERLSWRTYRQILARLPARVTIAIVDACSSGSAFATKGAALGELFAPATPIAETSSGLVVISSSRETEPSFESEELGGAFFSHYLVSGVRGAADADADGRVTLDELYRYAYHGTVAETARSLPRVQRPSFHMDLRGEGELVIGRIPRALTTVGFGRELEGSYLLAKRFGPAPAVIEVQKERGRLARVGVRPGAYVLYRRDANQVWLMPVELVSGRELVVEASRLRPYAYREVSGKGGQVSLGVWSVAASGRLASSLAASFVACPGGALRGDWEGFVWGWSAGLAVSRCSFRAVGVDILNDEWRAHGGPTLAWRWPGLTLRAGASLAVARVAQDPVETVFYPRDRSVVSYAPGAGLDVAAELELPASLFLRAGPRVELWLVKATDGLRLRATPTVEVGVGLRIE